MWILNAKPCRRRTQPLLTSGRRRRCQSQGCVPLTSLSLSFFFFVSILVPKIPFSFHTSPKWFTYQFCSLTISPIISWNLTFPNPTSPFIHSLPNQLLHCSGVMCPRPRVDFESPWRVLVEKSACNYHGWTARLVGHKCQLGSAFGADHILHRLSSLHVLGSRVLQLHVFLVPSTFKSDPSLILSCSSMPLSFFFFSFWNLIAVMENYPANWLLFLISDSIVHLLRIAKLCSWSFENRSTGLVSEISEAED